MPRIDHVVSYQPPALSQPHWYVQPEDQVEHVLKLNFTQKWGIPKSEFPTRVPRFEQKTPTELLLLAIGLPDGNGMRSVERTFTEHLSVIRSQLSSRGCDIHCWDNLKTDPQHLKLVPGVTSKSGLQWVVFDYAAHWQSEEGHRVSDLWKSRDTANLASSEILSALMLFPEWGLNMNGASAPFPNLSGYRLDRNEINLHIEKQSNAASLRLDARFTNYRCYGSASPMVRYIEY